MPENQRDDLKMERLIARARTAPDLREGTKDRILAGFDSIGRGKGRKRNPFQYLRYHPRTFLIIVIPFFLLLSVWGAYRIVHVPREYYSPLVFSSGEAHRTGTPETPLAPGDEIGEDDTVTVAPDDVCDLGLDDTPVFRFFPSSRFTVTDNTASTDRLVIRLEAGSLYINRDPEKAGVKKVAIESGNYRFVLEGTRVLFESLPERLDVSCFEGRVRVIAEEDRRLRELFLLLAGEKIGIELGEAKGHYRIDPVTREDIRIDDAFIGFPSFDRDLVEAVYRESGGGLPQREKPRAIEAAGEYRREEHTGAPDVSREPETPDYEITVKWDIGEASYASDNRIHFFAAASDAEKTYIVSEKKLFSVGDGRIREVLRLGGRESFRIGPVTAGNYICAISTQQIYLVDRGRLTVESSIPMEKDGIVDDNYYPVSREGVLYIPVSNYGYYILDTSSPRPSPVKLYAELFPLSPVINGGGVFVGSFYGNYVASLDEKGNVRWKHAIGGNSYSNMTLSGGALYIYVLENGRPSVVSINADGKKTGQWILDGRMVTDLVSYNGSLFGLYTDGGLFRLDTASMRPETIATVFSAALSSKAQRNLRPLVHEGILYIGTDSGELLIYDIEDRAVKDNVAVGDGTAFYTPPFFCEGGVCLVSNGGRVYSIVKTGR